MNNLFKSLRTRLFFWYLTSLISLATFFYLAIHFFALEYGNEIFILLFIILAAEGFYMLHKLTHALVKLTEKLRQISSKNLDERITDIDSEDEIGELAKTFNQLLDRLDESFKREQQFIGDIAHELKTPLATLRTTTEIGLMKSRTSKEYQQILSENMLDINRISSTLKNVLDLAWAEADASNQTMKRFNLSESLTQLDEIATKLSLQKKILVTTETEPEVMITGDEDKITHALLNIIDNAIKYTPDKGKVYIKLSHDEGFALVTITDTGAGIVDEDIDHIFDRFYRGSKTAKVLGSGLGLAISQSIIKTHKGNITVKSRTGHGSTFTIRLPLAN